MAQEEATENAHNSFESRRDKTLKMFKVMFSGLALLTKQKSFSGR